MIGRYGVDDLSRAQIIVSMVLLLVSTFLSAFFRVNILYWLGLALLIYSYFRILSRNVSKRYEENQRYLNAKYRAVVKKNNLKKRWAQRSTYRFFKCPQCKQTVRVPKGRGKICITCPKCKTEFIKKSWQRRKALCLVISISIKKSWRKKAKKHIRHITVGFADNWNQIVEPRDRWCLHMIWRFWLFCWPVCMNFRMKKQSLHVRCIRRRSVLHGSMTPQNMRRIWIWS